MRFLMRSLAGVFLLSLTAGLVVLALGNIYAAMEARRAEEGRGRAPEERVYAVNVAPVEVGPAVPFIGAYGTVSSRRMLEIRATASGRVVELAPAFRDGGRVAAGEVLLRIDPADAQAALDLARAELAEARAQAREAETGHALAQEDLAAAEQTRDLREKALARQRDLETRGAGTGAAVETSEIALASADQAVVGRRQALAQADAQRDLAAIAVERREIALREAERALAETTVTAPFGGLLTAAAVVEGGLVNDNEKLGSLIDTGALEVAFRVSNAQYARLIGPDGRLRDIAIAATLPLEEFPLTVTGTVDRAGAQVGEGQTGRLIYARLDAPGAAALRPGDFLTVAISEPPLEGVSVLPASAANNAGEILLLGEDDRLEAAKVEILRRQGDDIIVRGAPEGRDYVRERLPQLGEGVKVRPVRAGDQTAGPEMITLDPERKARLIAAVEGNTGMPDQARARILERLRGDTVPRDVVERIETRMAGVVPGDGTAGAVSLDPDRRARLIAFVEGSAAMPQDVKARLIAQLNEPQVPANVVERLERRMGG